MAAAWKLIIGTMKNDYFMYYVSYHSFMLRIVLTDSNIFGIIWKNNAWSCDKQTGPVQK